MKVLIVGASSELAEKFIALLKQNKIELAISSSKPETLEFYQKMGCKTIFLDLEKIEKIELFTQFLDIEFWPDVVYFFSGVYDKGKNKTLKRTYSELMINFTGIACIQSFFENNAKKYPKLIFINSIFSYLNLSESDYYSTSKNALFKLSKLNNLKTEGKNVNIFLGPVNTANRIKEGKNIPKWLVVESENVANFLYKMINVNKSCFFFPTHLVVLHLFAPLFNFFINKYRWHLLK